jgi:hypothetical protein
LDVKLDKVLVLQLAGMLEVELEVILKGTVSVLGQLDRELVVELEVILKGTVSVLAQLDKELVVE